jgi:hypothetical protein
MIFSVLPAVSLLGCFSLLYLLDASIIHIPFYEDFELAAFVACCTFVISVYSVIKCSQEFLAASFNVLTVFFLLRAVFTFQQFANRCDPLGSVCAMTRAYRFSTTLALFLTLGPCAGLYGASAYHFLTNKTSSEVAQPEIPGVCLGQPANKQIDTV